MQPVKELSVGSPALGLDWARNTDTGEITLGVATRDGKLFTIDPETWAQKDVVELDPPTPIWRVVGNHHATQSVCDFALATLNAGVIGIKARKGVMWQHPFGSSCGAITLARRESDGKQLLIAGALDKTIRGIDLATGKLVWGQVFLEGVGFVDIFELGQEPLAVAGDAAGNVRCFNAFTGTMRWHGEFGQNARFCVPIPKNKDEGPRWIIGTDEKKIHICDINNKSTAIPSISVPVKEFPWQARVIKNNVIVSIYDFANLGEFTTPTTGEMISLSSTGLELWKVTFAGSAEDFEVVSRTSEEEAGIYLASNAGIIVCIDPGKGTLTGILSLSQSPVNCIKLLPTRKSPELALAVACDDGRVIMLEK